MDWRIIAVATPVLFVSFQSLVRLLPKDASIFLVNAYGAAVTLVIMLVIHLATQADKSVVLTGKSLAISVGIGALIGLGNVGVIKALSLGAPQSTFTPLFYITLIIYGVLFGVIFFRENINFMQVLGVVVAISGILMAFYFKDG